MCYNKSASVPLVQWIERKPPKVPTCTKLTSHKPLKTSTLSTTPTKPQTQIAPKLHQNPNLTPKIPTFDT